MFIELIYGSNFNSIQLVIDDSIENFIEIDKTTLYSSLKVKGILVKSQGKQDI